MTSKEVDELARDLPGLTLHGALPVSTSMALAARVVELLERVQQLEDVREVLTASTSNMKRERDTATANAKELVSRALTREAASWQKAEDEKREARRRCASLETRLRRRTDRNEWIHEKVIRIASNMGYVHGSGLTPEGQLDAALRYIEAISEGRKGDE